MCGFAILAICSIDSLYGQLSCPLNCHPPSPFKNTPPSFSAVSLIHRLDHEVARQLATQQHQMVAQPHHLQAQQVAPPPESAAMLYKRPRLSASESSRTELTTPLQIDIRDMGQGIKRVCFH